MDKREELKERIEKATERLQELDKAEKQKAVDELRASINDLQERIENNPENKDPEKLRKDSKYAVYFAEAYGNSLKKTSKDKLDLAVSLFKEWGYNTENTLNTDGSEKDDLVRASIEAQVQLLNVGLYEIRNGLRKKAENSFEFAEKYGRKRTTAKTYGKRILYSFLYTGYLSRDRLSAFDTPLYVDSASLLKSNSIEEALINSEYVHFEEWLNRTYEATIFVHKDLLDSLRAFFNKMHISIGVEMFLKTNNIDIQNAPPCSRTALDMLDLREDAVFIRVKLDYSLRYLNVFDTLLRLTAQELDIPELDFFALDLPAFGQIIEKINQSLDSIRSARNISEDDEAFRKISPDIPPIPQENIKATRAAIRNTMLLGGNEFWTGMLVKLSRDYWRR